MVVKSIQSEHKYTFKVTLHATIMVRRNKPKKLSFADRIRQKREQRRIMKRDITKKVARIQVRERNIHKREKVEHKAAKQRANERKQLSKERAKIRRRLREGGVAKRGARFLGRQALAQLRKRR